MNVDRLKEMTDNWAERNGQPAREDPIHLTDLGNARRMAADHGEDLRHCHPWKKWLVWDGKRWRVDDTATSTRRAKKTITSQFRWAMERMDAIRKEMEAAGEGEGS